MTVAGCPYDDGRCILQTDNTYFFKLVQVNEREVFKMNMNHGFTEEPIDANSLLYLRNRYYNPELGTFMSLDPHEGTPTRPMSLNGYSYVEGDPVNNTDPSGLCVNRRINEPVPPGSESETLLCRANVSVLQSNFGITLTQEEALDFDDVWTTTRVENVFTAVRSISDSFRPNYRAVADGTSLIIREAQQTNCGQTPGRESISLYRCGENFDNPYTVNNIIHEFGHIFINRVGRSIIENWDMIEVFSGKRNVIQADSDAGFGAVRRENPSTEIAEQIPDMYMYWVTDASFSSDEIGELRRSFSDGVDLDLNGTEVVNPGFAGYAGQINRGASNSSDNTLVSGASSRALVDQLNSGCSNGVATTILNQI
jgi:RHS repeat-associated protein